MHHYQHNIGDWNDATMHLSRIERSIYREAIDLYYKTEQPLNTCSNRLQRLLRITTEDERAALDFILDEFFYKTEDGYENERCEKLISEFRESQKSSSKAGQVSGLSREINKLVSDFETKIETANTKKEQTDLLAELERRYERALNKRSQDVRKMFEQKANKNEPTNKLIDLKTKYMGDFEEKPEASDDACLDKPKQSTKDCDDVIDYLNEKAKKNFNKTRANRGLVKSRLNDGNSVSLIKSVIDLKVSEWADDKKMSQYLRPSTLFSAKNFDSYSGEVGKPKKPLNEWGGNKIETHAKW